MSPTRHRGLDVRRVRQLLARVKAHRSAAARVDVLSGLLLGLPYDVDPLVGSPASPEVFTASLEGFDCVTYVETVLALALARRAADFAPWLQRIRYQGGQVEWARRNHYMTGWIRSNARVGAVRQVTGGALAVRKDRLLDAVIGLPPRQTRFTCVPKARIGKLEPLLATGDLVFFASTRPHLDVFHCGILVGDGGRLRLRHATRSQGGVVEQDLRAFLKGCRASGLIVARPVGEIGTGGR